MLRLKIVIVLFLCLVVVQISNAFDDTGGVYEISATIAPDGRRELDNIISTFGTDISNESIKSTVKNAAQAAAGAGCAGSVALRAARIMRNKNLSHRRRRLKL
jgi:hypothetical protein